MNEFLNAILNVFLLNVLNNTLHINYNLISFNSKHIYFLTMNHTLTVSAAYGRDFKSKKEILNYWNSNRDFQNLGYFNSDINYSGSYINKQDAKRLEINSLMVRYKNLMNIAVIDVSKDTIK